MENVGNLVLRQGGQAGLPGTAPQPGESPLPGEQERFEGRLNAEESATRETGAPDRIAASGPAQGGFFRPPESVASNDPAVGKTGPADTAARTLRVSGDAILEGLLRVDAPFSPGLPAIDAVSDPKGLLAVRTSLMQGGTAIEMMNRLQSQADEGIEQLTKG